MFWNAGADAPARVLLLNARLDHRRRRKAGSVSAAIRAYYSVEGSVEVLDEASAPTRYRSIAPLGSCAGDRCYVWYKRILDVGIAALLLIALSPLMLLVAVLIKLDTAGPALFVQERVGCGWRDRRRRTFDFYKFRSMICDCDQSLHIDHVRRWAHSKPGPSADGARQSVKLADDPRITRMGRLIRQTSLDELPQLWNVLKGDMSLVGPRPVPLYEVAEYEPWHARRLEVIPGITGLWQVEGRGRVTLDEMAALDIEYIHKRSLTTDLLIMARTIPVVLARRGAR